MRGYGPSMSHYGGLVAMGALMALIYGLYRGVAWSWGWIRVLWE